MSLCFDLMGVDLKAVGDRMREARRRAGLTQEQLASLVGVTGSAVSQWENGQTMPDLRPIIALCQSSANNSADEILSGRRLAQVDEFERQMLETFRQLPREFQLAAHANINQLWELAHPGETGPASPFAKAVKPKG
jgi:transcriptional regulator with XRE-family HTH domain